MKVKIKVEKEYDAKYLIASIGARYWEDATVDGVEDIEGKLIPCIVGDYWQPQIDLESGKILNWEQGKKASIHYKSCDDNIFRLLDKSENVICEIEGYVIDMMTPKESGYGDYVIMDILEDGTIVDFKADLSVFEESED